ncbi:ThuA domain-containing protein [Fibrella forsythiae]|uniref:ThuA domain-containing protein n=1 Tax=Fibrella forsythiae TaxID=2817061 RepID=A0ABS3JLD2_9BACT|nr:ThuA domain-containing protein [Fibrella forsythiae]MBO0950811.1 ThuA domain-containing protein [Fibrella forsythiae]
MSLSLKLVCLGVISAFVVLQSGMTLRKSATPPTVLVFSKTKGWHHTSIPFGIAAVQQLGQANGFAVDTTTDATLFTDDNLKKYAAVVWMSTTGNVLNGEQQAAFERYIQAGGGYVGVHAAADTEYDWPWYGKLMGAFFSSHPHNSNIRKATVEVVDATNPATAMLPARWERTDEWYNYRSFYSGIKVLADLDENTYEGGTNGAHHHISWYHDFDGGRAFYTGNGHTDESYSDPLFLGHLLGGLKYAIGDNKPLDYSKAYANVTPDQNRFVKTVLVNDLNAPMELAVAPNGQVFFTELFGNLSMYDPRTGKSALVHKLPITNMGGTGLIGMTLDPAFAQNRNLYLYYAPAGLTEDNLAFRLSRFTLNANNTLNLASEKVLLNVPVQKNSGSHHGGSLAWDKDGNLYLSTGDSSSPFPSNGYSPLDERPDKESYSLDSQRSAGNTNDLKGKVLRIHPEANGTYTIPAGNLFPNSMAKTLPEIYTMGCRNPYRIAVNPKTSVLYWGEIGPDAGKDGEQGPRGYDEFNQAKRAGNYGWPYFVGNNSAYTEWDFATKTAGPAYNPAAPVNNSPNNTGLAQLPPATPAMIWYPYAASAEFPELGVGGRSAMAGEFYTFNKANTSPTKFPDYYDGALFVFDWMRNWVMALRFDANENYVRSEPFMAGNGDFRRPIDLAFGPDGVMYMLEYGSVYGADNEDARLVKIEYNTGNRAPVAKASIVDSATEAYVDKTVFLTSERRNFPLLREADGQPPLRVLFNSRGSRDLDDDDAITYQWLFDGKTVGATTPNATFTYQKPGTYHAILKVTDRAGLVGRDTVVVHVGDTRPKVTITSPGNTSFFWPNKPFAYAVKVTDKEDVRIDPKRIKVTYLYDPQPSALSSSVPGISATTIEVPAPPGKLLMANSDCKACHTIDKVSVGPSLLAIAQRYKGQSGALEQLATKIINGGGGNWSTEHVMSAHPQLSTQDAQEMVRYIYSLTDPTKKQAVLPLQGTLALTDHPKDDLQGQYTLLASYKDKGGNLVKPLTGTDLIRLRSATVKAAYADAHVGFSRFRDNLSQGGHKSYILLKNIDLTGIKQFTYEYGSANQAGEVEVRIDSQAGPVVSSVAYGPTGSWDTLKQVTGLLSKPVTGRHDVYFFAIKRTKPNDEILKFSTIQFEE